MLVVFLGVVYARGPDWLQPVAPLLVGVALIAANAPLGELFSRLVPIRGDWVIWTFRVAVVAGGTLLAVFAVLFWTGAESA